MNLVNTLRSIATSLLTHIVFELPGGKSGLEHLVNLLQSPILGLWKEEQDEESHDHVAAEPDIPIFGTPIKHRWIDEVGRSEGTKPVA